MKGQVNECEKHSPSERVATFGVERIRELSPRESGVIDEFAVRDKVAGVNNERYRQAETK
jgi:hypothetical protein